MTSGHDIKNDLGDIDILPREDDMNKVSSRSLNLSLVGGWVENISEIGTKCWD